MADNKGKDFENLEDIVEDIESLGMLSRTDFEDMEIMREDETFATMVEEHISDEELDELTRAFQDLEGQISTPATIEDFAAIELDAGEFGDMSEDDLDAMLKSLMREEGGEDWVPIDNIDAQLEQEPEIYETGETDKDFTLIMPDVATKAVRSRGPRKWVMQQYRAGDKGTKALMLVVASMSGLVAASLLFLFGVLIAGNMGGRPQGTFNVSPPPHAFNNASHSLVNLSAPLGDDTIVLNRLLLDEVATVFYFGQVLDPARYIFTLEDFDGRIYQRNVSLMPNLERGRAQDQTVVHFEALDPATEGFTISVTDLHTGQTSYIELTFDADAIAAGRHLTDPMAVDTGLSNIDISIDSATFSAAASSLNFSISYANPDIGLVFGESAVAGPVGLRHMGMTVPAMGALQTSHFPQEGILLGAIDFNPLRSLTGRVDVIFGHLYKHYETNITMPAMGMFTAGGNRERTIELADHIINIHGMDHRGHIFVMPLFGAPRAVGGEEPQRVPTTMEVALVGIGEYPHTQQIRVPGTVIYGPRGTDVIFDASENEGILGIPRNNLYLEFSSVSVRLPEVIVTIDLDELGFEPSSHAVNVKSAIESAFAREMAQFAGQFGAAQNVEYAVQVQQMRLDGSVAYARVVERLAFTDRGSLQEVLRHHRITANITDATVEVIGFVESVEQRP
ncbi:MAG: hypothetical protein LBE55_05890 [Clostridiales bacterium]|nr:hypothetical protein [Clostridiales bacterium]